MTYFVLKENNKDCLLNTRGGGKLKVENWFYKLNSETFEKDIEKCIIIFDK